MKRVLLGDVVIAVIAAAVILVISMQVYKKNDSEPLVHIRVEDKQWVYDLKQERTVLIPGPLGDTEVVIENGYVHVLDSPCQAKICVASGEISRNNEWIICLPNRVFITIVGKKESGGDVDEVVY
jgi:hypothetical protein